MWHKKSQPVRTLTFRNAGQGTEPICWVTLNRLAVRWGEGDPPPGGRRPKATPRPGYSALISAVMSLTDAFASPNSIAVFGL